MGNKLFILSLILFLSACAHNETKCQECVPSVIYKTQTVNVPYPVYCKTPDPEKPEFNFPKIDPEMDIYEKTKILLADIKLHLAYETELLAVLKTCRQE